MNAGIVRRLGVVKLHWPMPHSFVVLTGTFSGIKPFMPSMMYTEEVESGLIGHDMPHSCMHVF